MAYAKQKQYYVSTFTQETCLFMQRAREMFNYCRQRLTYNCMDKALNPPNFPLNILQLIFYLLYALLETCPFKCAAMPTLYVF